MLLVRDINAQEQVRMPLASCLLARFATAIDNDNDIDYAATIILKKPRTTTTKKSVKFNRTVVVVAFEPYSPALG